MKKNSKFWWNYPTPPYKRILVERITFNPKPISGSKEYVL
jgi:hypothetical protein